MALSIQSGLSPGAIAQPADVAAPGAKPVAEPAIPHYQPTPIQKADIKVDTAQMKQNLEEAINRLNEMMRDGGRGLNFAMDSKLGRPIVLVKNAETGELIRQILNEVVVRVAHSIEELKGVLHNAIV